MRRHCHSLVMRKRGQNAGIILFIIYFFVSLDNNLLFGQANLGDGSLGSSASFSFEPLAKEETFAYKVVDDNKLTLFAKINVSGNLRLIGTWSNVNYWSGPISCVDGLDFSLDRKYCYFWIWDEDYSKGTIFFVDGPKGTATPIVENIKSSYRSSSSGEYLIYADPDKEVSAPNNHKFVIIDAFDSYKKTDVTWDIDDYGGSFGFMRVGNTDNFRILLVDEGYSVIATAVVNPATGTLTSKPITFGEMNNRKSFRDKKWRDSVSYENLDPNLRVPGSPQR